MYKDAADCQRTIDSDRRVELHGNKKLIFPGAGKDSQSIRGRFHVVLQVCADTFGVGFKAPALGRAGLKRTRYGRKLFADKRLEVIASMLIGLCIQIEADDG